MLDAYLTTIGPQRAHHHSEYFWRNCLRFVETGDLLAPGKFDSRPVEAGRVMQAMMAMPKLLIADMQRAYDANY